MKIKFFEIVVFLFLTQLSIAQVSYSTSQLQDFVTIYMDAKESKSIHAFEMILKDKLEEYNISFARYREIFQANISGTKVDLSTNEVAFFNGIQEANDKIKSESSEVISKLCSTKSIDYEIYLKIHDTYKTDIKFQRSLKPYFDQYLKTKK
ncbi:MAG: hypothetical protein ACJA1A_002333 [Saprospiraceae bacterium]|jgi:hypothetical protein